MAKYSGLGADILNAYEASESEGGDAGDFGIDSFTNKFEDEFPGDNDDLGGTYLGYSPEANRPIENRPWGDFSDRPKVWELNQPSAAQVSGLRIIDLIPRRNRKWVFHRLAGTPTELRLLIQTIQATRQLTGANIDFDQWFELYRNGFLGFIENRNLGNFQLTGDNQWERLKNPETRPRWEEWTSSFQRADLGFRTGEYWPDRSQESNSFLLSGTDLMLINQILQIDHQQAKNALGGKSNNQQWPPFKGQPLIKLYFVSADGAVAVTSFRIMAKTDDPKVPLPKIDKTDLRNYAQKIKDQFATPLFTWEKGKQILSYKNRFQGFDGQWWLCRNAAGGRELLTRLLAIQDAELDTSKLRMSAALDEAAAFPENPPDIVVLDKPAKQEKERPIVDVVFASAEIYLSKLKKPISLVERGRIVYN